MRQVDNAQPREHAGNTQLVNVRIFDLKLAFLILAFPSLFSDPVCNQNRAQLEVLLIALYILYLGLYRHLNKATKLGTQCANAFMESLSLAELTQRTLNHYDSEACIMIWHRMTKEGCFGQQHHMTVWIHVSLSINLYT